MAGDHARAAGAGSSDVGSASGISGVEKLVGAEAGGGCSGGYARRHRRSLWRRQQWCGGDGGGTCKVEERDIGHPPPHCPSAAPPRIAASLPFLCASQAEAREPVMTLGVRIWAVRALAVGMGVLLVVALNSAREVRRTQPSSIMVACNMSVATMMQWQ